MAEDHPVIPHAAPSRDAQGRLTYTGDDGRRYVVGLPPDTDEEGLERVMGQLQDGNPLFSQIESLCQRWIEAVQSRDLDRRAALELLLTTLETTLEDRAQEPE